MVDGHIANKKIGEYTMPTGIGITCNPINNDNFIESIIHPGEHTLGIELKYHLMRKVKILFKCYFAHQLLEKMFKHLFGEHYDGKKLWPEFYNMSHRFVYAFCAGLISTDVCVTKDGNIQVELTNNSFMKSVYHLVRTHGIDASFKIKHHKDNQDTAGVNFPFVKEILCNVNKTYTDGRISKKNKNQTSAIVHNGQKFLRVKSITVAEERPEHVYTLGVDNDHSYNVEGICVQNCFLLGTGDSIEEY